ncbi:hypothetical protein CARUB_v10010664mg [Capsella rubella]|uniref:Uncharacterized protein n=1 Tax=Capsella rubella TaxID=81985 RepID=R0INH9_9BRAS|nr:uncharacterized protein LOC17898496 [Capsella rubella]EOA38683.1 hypothetical protein CARUB_v10010664mg [Capsella rubella]
MKRERKRQGSEEEEEKKKERKTMEVVVVDALAAAATVAAAAAVKEEEDLWGMRLKAGDDVVVDELMTWSTVWLPSCWDVEFVEKNYEALYNDVVWDDDLWNLDISSTHDQLPPLDNNISQD